MTPCSFVTIKSIKSILSIDSSTSLISNSQRSQYHGFITLLPLVLLKLINPLNMLYLFTQVIIAWNVKGVGAGMKNQLLFGETFLTLTSSKSRKLT